jgi:ectoine hydroxylase-related dioxygenase (phytanoyl-CoA dioxygenase family)
MTPEDILAHKPIALSQEQREFFFENGFVAAEGLVSDEWLERLRARSDEFIDRSRQFSESNKEYDLSPDHTPDKPYVRRLRAPVDRHPDFWEFAPESVFTEVAADLVGPDVKFHSCKVNYKHPGGGEVVKWHQDIPAWPHTNFSPVTLGVYFHDVGEAEGPLACIPGSHKGELYSHFNEDRSWSGYLSKDDLLKAKPKNAVNLTGKAGTIIAINCRTIHGSMDNKTDQERPLLLYVYSSADAFTWMPSPTPTTKSGEIVRGKAAQFVHMDPFAIEVPPNWDKEGYGSIFASQRKETLAKAS